MSSHNSKTVKGHFEFYKDRSENIDLDWCRQVVEIIKTYCQNKIRINDIGCLYGQLYKEIKRLNLEKFIDYYGYDYDEKFLELGKVTFPEIKNKFILHDIEKNKTQKSNITVCSAVLEHLDSPKLALNNMMDRTDELFILRTMIGPETKIKTQNNKKFVDNEYNINQFNLFDLTEDFINNGFSLEILPDEATNFSKKYEVGKGSKIYRQIFVLLGKRIR